MSEKQNFFEEIYEVVKLIPQGRVTSYGAIANYLGLKGGARMVGWAMNGVGDRMEIPAHRVVNRNGLLTGKHHFATPTEMQERLEKEGIIIEDNQIKKFEKVFWNPMSELNL
jgi:methylated-DNA-protein-cysteine methyltransferase-like protein